MRHRISLLALAMLTTLCVRADKGHIWPRPIALSEASQRAILLHNGQEEVLILGIELKARETAEILEFIPFPSEPQVALAEGDPFARIQRLLREKGVQIEPAGTRKGEKAATAVEIRFAAQVGLHDVTVVRINDGKALSGWVTRFFKDKGLGAPENLEPVVRLAEDYLRRGYCYFVFDHVPVQPEPKLVEPLCYRFTSARLYYPLKTSNLVGGTGAVDLVMLLPGSFAFESAWEQERRFWDDLRGLSAARPDGWRLSSSSKVYPAEAREIYPGADAFFKRTKKQYLQVLQFRGGYQFRDDLSLDLAGLVPYADKIPVWQGYGRAPERGFEQYTEDEIKDYCEAKPDSPLCKAWLAGTKNRPEGRSDEKRP